MMDTSQPVYVSPHPDDAVLSCGGLMVKQVRVEMEPLIITVFAGTPDYAHVSPFARVQHGYWGDPPDPMALRRQEDIAAADRLGTTVYHLPFLDAVYRTDPDGRPLYASEEAIFGDVVPPDGALTGQIADYLDLLLLPGSHLYVPLAAGNHVDHQIVRASVEGLAHRGIPLTFYEDFPYVTRTDESDWRPAVTASLQPQIEALDDAALQAKIEAISCYTSQLDILFGSAGQMPEVVTGYGRRHATPAALFGERYWRPQKRTGG
ncbi:MAG: PIG-L family deacetylase [Chloroflexi bacterium]|nr:PIG-L family deacetylase [Chloroflexota bacterium]